MFKLSCFENWSYKIFPIAVQFDMDLPFSENVTPYREIHADVTVYIFAHFAYGFAYRKKHVWYISTPGS